MARIEGSVYVACEFLSRQAGQEFVSGLPDHLIDGPTRSGLMVSIGALDWLPEAIPPSEEAQVREQIAHAIEDLQRFTAT